MDDAEAYEEYQRGPESHVSEQRVNLSVSCCSSHFPLLPPPLYPSLATRMDEMLSFNAMHISFGCYITFQRIADAYKWAQIQVWNMVPDMY